MHLVATVRMRVCSLAAKYLFHIKENKYTRSSTETNQTKHNWMTATPFRVHSLCLGLTVRCTHTSPCTSWTKNNWEHRGTVKSTDKKAEWIALWVMCTTRSSDSTKRGEWRSFPASQCLSIPVDWRSCNERAKLICYILVINQLDLKRLVKFWWLIVSLLLDIGSALMWIIFIWNINGANCRTIY